MKRNSILICLLFAITANLFTTAKAQVNTTDSLALVDLYNSTNGPHWKHHNNWLTINPVSTWYGVVVTNNSVTYLTLRDNGLSGTIPTSIGNLVNLTDLLLYTNTIGGTIPASVGSLTNLVALGLSSNKLNGIIPPSIGNLVNLTNLSLATNQLTGAIPSSIGNLKNLYNISLYNNKLTGAIPTEIGNLTNLTYLDFDNNKLSGVIPAEIGNLASIVILNLSGNQLSGAIPAEIGNPATLQYLYLNNNQLTGSIPATLSNPKYLSTINLSHNQLSQDSNIHFSSYNKTDVKAYINYNLFTFNGLEFLVNKYFDITYSPQDTILPIHPTGNLLSLSAGGKLNNNTYRWHQVGVDTAIVIKKDSTFAPAQSGRYYVTVTNKVATQLTLYSDTINFVMAAAQQSSNLFVTKAIQSATMIKNMQIFPNPSSNNIHVQVSGNATIIFTNSSGKILLSKSINNSGEINVSGYANSVYYLQNKTTGETQKVVVVH